MIGFVNTDYRSCSCKHSLSQSHHIVHSIDLMFNQFLTQISITVANTPCIQVLTLAQTRSAKPNLTFSRWYREWCQASVSTSREISCFSILTSTAPSGTAVCQMALHHHTKVLRMNSSAFSVTKDVKVSIDEVPKMSIYTPC